MTGTFESTNTLKGIAITAVLINHYLNRNLSGDYFGFATQWLSLFFMLSGYGIYLSLEKFSIENGKLTIKNILSFYFLRIVRIFPLFIMAYILQQILFDKEIYLYSLMGIHGTGHFWFVPAILQCYLVSPLIYMLIYFNRLIALFLIVLLFIFSNYILNIQLAQGAIVKALNFVHLNWNNSYFLYIFIFSLSMFLPQYIQNWREVVKSEKYFHFFLFLSLIILYMITVKWTEEFKLLYSYFVITLIPITLIGLMAIYLLCNRFHFMFFSWLGKRAYSIYLFHIIFYYLINLVFKYGRDSIKELIITLSLFPLFLTFCYMLTVFSNKVSISLYELTGPLQAEQ